MIISLFKKYNTPLILVGVFLAIILGIYTPTLLISIKFLGDIFINLLKLFALPLIFSTVIVSLGSMENNLSNVKFLVRGVVSYMLLSEIIAVTIALILFNLFNAGKGIDPNLILQGSQYTTENTNNLRLDTFFLALCPQNIFDSLAKFDLLPVLMFSIMFGIACTMVGAKAQAFLKVCAAVRDISNTCLHGVMILSPIGIFVLVGSGVATSSSSGQLVNSFISLIMFVSMLILGLLIHALWQLIFAVILSKQTIGKILKSSIAVFSTAFATSSSIVTLPTAIDTADYLKSHPIVTRFMLPLCASINVGGMMMYEVAAALFFSQILGINLPLSQQIFIALASILGGMAEGGIPETSLVSLAVVFKIVHIPLNAISILLPLDRIIDRLRTVVNIFGNMCGSIIVSQFLKNKFNNQKINPSLKSVG